MPPLGLELGVELRVLVREGWVLLMVSVLVMLKLVSLSLRVNEPDVDAETVWERVGVLDGGDWVPLQLPLSETELERVGVWDGGDWVPLQLRLSLLVWL